MNLNKLPVLIRTEVTAAAKSAGLPAVYSRALIVLEEAVNELSFSKLKTVEISAEGLAAWAKAHQDEKLTKTARELKFRARRTANYIAEQLVKQRRAAFLARGGTLVGFHKGVPSTQPEAGGVGNVLRSAGYSIGETRNIQAAALSPDAPKFAHMSDTAIKKSTRGKGRTGVNNVRSAVYHEVFGSAGSPLRLIGWFRQNSARGIARNLVDEESIKSRQKITLVRAWCDEFLKNLPRTVSKARV